MAQSKLEILISAINQASGPIQDVVNDINAVQDRARNTLEVGERITNFGRQYVDGVSRPIMQGLGASVNAAIALESAMADTNKALGVQPNTDGARALQAEIMSLSGELGVLPTAIAGFYAEAGKLGIQSGQIGDYTRLVNQAGVAWDMTSDQAGGAIATLTNVMGLFDSKTGTVDLQGLSQLGDTINYLADTGATSESAIANVLQRSGSTMRMFGLLNQESAALATGFLNLGYPPEVVGTAMNGMLPKLQNATQQTNDFQSALASIGLPAAQFEQMVAKDATGAITTLMDAAAKSGDTGIFQKLFGTGSDSALLTAAAQNLENFKGTLQSIDKVTSGGMGASYENRLQTTAAQMESFRAQMFILGSSIGSAVLPAINDVIGAITPLVSKFAEFAQANPGLMKIGIIIAGIAAAVGPLIIGFGMLVSAVGAITAAFGAGGALAGVASVIGGVFTAIAGIGAGPLLLIVAAIAAGAALIIANWEPISAFFSNLWQGITTAAQGFWQGLTTGLAPAMPAIESLKQSFTSIWNSLTQVGSAVLQFVQPLLQLGARIFELTPLGQLISQIGQAFQGAGAGASSFGNMVGSAIAKVLQGVANAVAGAANLAQSFVAAGQRIISTLQSVASQAFSAGQNIVQRIAAGITAGIGAVSTAIGAVANRIRSMLPNSPVPEGPLTILNNAATGPGANIVRMIAAGIVPGPIQSAMSNALTPVSTMSSASPIPLGNSGGAIAPTGGGTGGSVMNYTVNMSVGSGANINDFKEALNSHKDELARLWDDMGRQRARINYA